MKNKTIILAYSGGLDTSFCLKRLSSDGFNVHAILVNTGGFDKPELNNIKKQAIQKLIENVEHSQVIDFL